MKKVRLRIAFYPAVDGRDSSALSSTLGYVFWHRPRSAVFRKEYEVRLSAFHASLREDPADGLLGSLSFREPALPWSLSRAPAYEDWYLLRDFRSLGALNEAAVDSIHKGVHDMVAVESLVVAGGLYRLLTGDMDLQSAKYATWLRKPTGTSYRAFRDQLAEATGGLGTDLWQRQLVLGPAPEFCLHSEGLLSLPRAFRPRTLRLQRVGDGAA
jgi:hypothetical protein